MRSGRRCPTGLTSRSPRARAQGTDPQSRPDPLRAHDDLPVRVSAGVCHRHGQRPGGYAEGSIKAQLCSDAHLLNFGACPPGARPALRPQRLRRDPAWTLGVGRQAPLVRLGVVGQPRQRLRCGGLPQRRAGDRTASYRQRMTRFSEMGLLNSGTPRVGEEDIRGLLTEAKTG